MKRDKNRFIPLTVPKDCHKTYLEHLQKATQGTNKLFLFAGDQKIEHLNEDFYGNQIPKECGSPEHLFSIANSSRIGIFAAQLGLIARYAHDYRNVNYLIKLNSKTNIIQTNQIDPLSRAFHSVEDVVEFKNKSGLSIVGVGYTIYLGSEYESIMLNQAAQITYQAHNHGLLSVLWIYPKGKAVVNEQDGNIIAGAAGVGAALGADFVKVNPPQASNSSQSALLLQQAIQAAGNTGVICSGGEKVDAKQFLSQLHEQITIGGTVGCAVGRNIHQRTLPEAQAFCNAIAALLYDNVDLTSAEQLLK
jgi:fructose-bisphosphate aldolase/6-deoxy-5-ketofructose 1-phosphate synthase